MPDRLKRTLRLSAVGVVLLLFASACGGGDGGGDTQGATSAEGGGDDTGGTGGITIWYSNNEEEIAWAQDVVEAWNAENADQQVTAEELPAGDSSEEVIRASITAGNTPCLIYNTSPAAVPSFNRQGGLVNLSDFDDGASFIEERLGDIASQYQSEDGGYYQMPWKSNPVMVLYNKDIFSEAGLDPEEPSLSTYDEFLDASRTIVESGAAEAAIWPSPASQFFQPWFDFYPWFAAETGGTQLVEDGEPQFTSDAGYAVADFWQTMYDEGLSPQEESQGDTFAEGQAAMNAAGPWAVAVYSDVNWGVVPPPTTDGTPDEDTSTFSDAKSVGLYTSCENRQTAWEFLKFSMNEENDGQLLEATGQMPLRAGLTDVYADFFEQNPQFMPFADKVDNVVEVPSVPSSIDVWQTFRDAWSASVIFDDQQVEPAFQDAAGTISDLVSEG